jgi:hypothetical protein
LKKTREASSLRAFDFSENVYNFELYIKGKLMKPIDNHANQLNPNKGSSGINAQYKARMDNHANQLNPNNRKFQGGNKNG